jgi:hypothetical protein
MQPIPTVEMPHSQDLVGIFGRDDVVQITGEGGRHPQANQQSNQEYNPISIQAGASLAMRV